MLITTIVTLSLASFLGLYLFILFAWWWIKQGSATAIYKYTAGLMFGIFVSDAAATWLYIARAINGDDDLFKYVPYYWPLRHFFILLPLIMYTKHSTLKIYHEYKAKKQLQFEEERRKTKRRKFNGD
jgi:hypothetical protein